MASLFIDTRTARSEIDALPVQSRMASLMRTCDTRSAAGTEVLGTLATAVGEFPGAFTAQIARLVEAFVEAVRDVERADQPAPPGADPA